MTITNPYPGLRAFKYQENHLFFGREGQAKDVADKMQQNHFVAVVGTSGSGKSSLVRAGLLPLLHGGKVYQAGSRWRISLMRPGESPIRNLAQVLVCPERFESEETPLARDETQIGITDAILRRSGVGILDFFKNADFAEDENLLIVVDQFEEIFRFQDRLGMQDSDEAIAFVKLLLEATSDLKNRIYVVITMRSDFLGDCSEFRDLPEAINKGQYLIPRLTRDQLRLAIESPPMVFDAEISPALVNRLLNDIDQDLNRSDLPERMLRDRLPVLQHILMRMWDEWAALNTPDEPLSIKLYENPRIGNVVTALSIHADEAHADLSEEQKVIAEKMFKCLTETDAEGRQIRRVASVSEICNVAGVREAELFEIIEVFQREGRTFLMPPPNVVLTASTKIDISHESLIRNWELLKKWVKEEAEDAWQYRRLYEDAHLFALADGSLWSGRALEIALEWKKTFDPTPEWAARYQYFTEEEKRSLTESKKLSAANEETERGELVQRHFSEAMAFLDASEAKEKRDEEEKLYYINKLERQRKNLRIATTISLFLMVAAITSTVIAVWMWRSALADRDSANTAKQAAVEARDVAERKTDEAEKAQAIALSEKKNADDAKADALTKQAETETQRKRADDAAKEAGFQKDKANEAAAKSRDDAAKLETQLAANTQITEELTFQNGRAQANMDGQISAELGEFTDAKDSFGKLLLSREEFLKEQNSKEEKAKVLDSKVYEWWSDHNLGSIFDKLDDPESAQKAYSNALGVLGYTISPSSVNRSPASSDMMAFIPISYRNAAATKVDEIYVSYVAATLRRYGSFYRERAINKGKTEATGNNKSAAFQYNNLLAFLSEHPPKGGEETRKRTQYKAKVESELGETYFDLGDYVAAADKFKASYSDYKSYDDKASERRTVKARKLWTHAVSYCDKIKLEDENLEYKQLTLLEKKDWLMRDINKDVSYLDPDLADLYSDLSRIYSLDAYETEEKTRKFRDDICKKQNLKCRNDIGNTSNAANRAYNTASNNANYATNNAYNAANNVNYAANRTYNSANAAINVSTPSSTISTNEDFRKELKTEEEKKTFDELLNKSQKSTRQGDAYKDLFLALSNSETYPDTIGAGILGAEFYGKIFRITRLVSAYQRAKECGIANKILISEYTKAKEDRSLNTLLRFTMMAVTSVNNPDILKDETEAKTYSSIFKEVLDHSPEFEEFLKKLGSKPSPLDRGDIMPEIIEIARRSLAFHHPDKARERYEEYAEKIHLAEMAAAKKNENYNFIYSANIYGRLAKSLEKELVAATDAQQKKQKSAEVIDFYRKAISAVIAAKTDQTDIPILKYQDYLAGFYERQGGEENISNALKMYREMKTELDKSLNGRDPTTLIGSEDFPVRKFVKVVRKIGDTEKSADRKIEYYEQAKKVLESFQNIFERSDKTINHNESSGYVSWSELNKQFYTDQIEVLKVLQTPNNVADTQKKIADLVKKAEDADDDEYDFEPYDYYYEGPDFSKCTEEWDKTDSGPRIE